MGEVLTFQDEESEALGIAETARPLFSNELFDEVSEHDGDEYNNALRDTRTRAELFFGNRQFKYEHMGGVTYTGTATQILDACPQAQTTAGEQGFEAFANWIAPHEKTGEDKDEEKSPAEEDVKNDGDAEKTSVDDVGKAIHDVGKVAHKIPDLKLEKSQIKETKSNTPISDGIAKPAKHIVKKDVTENSLADSPRTVESIERIEPITAQLETPVIPKVIERKNETHDQQRAIELAREVTLSFFEEETVMTEVIAPETVEAHDEVAEIEMFEDELFTPNASTEYIESLFTDPEYSLYQPLLFDEEQEQIKTFEATLEVIEEHPDMPVELVLTQLMELTMNDPEESKAYVEDHPKDQDAQLFDLLQPERQLTQSEFKHALIRLRVEIAYAHRDTSTPFEELPASLQEQLLDLLHRLGYDDPKNALQQLIDRQGTEYLLYSISQMSTSAERTVHLHATKSTHKKKRHIASTYAAVHAKLGQFVIDSFYGSHISHLLTA